MRKLLIMCIILTLSSCVHKMDIEQGNIISDEKINQLHLGMNSEQVKNIMGTPLLQNTFDDNRMNYVYTYQPGYGDLHEKIVSLIFKNNQLQKMIKN